MIAFVLGWIIGVFSGWLILAGLIHIAKQKYFVE